MQSLKQIVTKIIEELTLLQENPSKAKEGDEDFPFPRMISSGERGPIIVSKQIDNLIADFARRMLDDNPKLKQRFTQNEWRRSARAAFGSPLAGIDLDNDLTQNALLVFEAVRDALASESAEFLQIDHVFGCTIFSDLNVPTFSIGPVRFEPRREWLRRTAASGLLSEATARRLVRVWSGKKVAKRKPLTDNDETDIVNAIGTAPYVCTVSTSGLGFGAASEKALMAARLALAAIALSWQTPSKALIGFNLQIDGPSYTKHSLVLIPTKKRVSTSSTRSVMPHGPWLPIGKWEEAKTNFSSVFVVIGECLELVLSPTGDVQRPKLMNVFSHALLWFHEGCREPVSLIAVVKFTACLDALAGGSREGGIRRLINARLGIMDNSPIRDGGPTLTQAIDQIYSQGRSRTIHGNNDKFGHDWTNIKDLCEQFARLCLIECLDWASKNPSCDDPKQMKTSKSNPAATR